MIVYVYPADPYGCGSYRMAFPARAAKANGVDVRLVMPSDRVGIGGRVDTRTGKLVELEYPRDADVIVFQRVAMNTLSQAVPYLRKRGVAVVVDMDDDLRRIDPNNPAFWGMRDDHGSPLHSAKNALQACLDATLVTVSTPALLKAYAPHGRGVVLENHVPAWYLDLPHRDSATIGWGGAVHSHPTDLGAMGPAVARLVREGVEYWGVGADYRFERGDDGLRRALGLKLGEGEVDTVGDVPLDMWPRAVATMGVGLAPLVDTEFNRGKCLDAETRVATQRGLLRIADIEPGDQVWRGEWRKVAAVASEPRRPGLAVTMESGRRIELSSEHRLYRLTTGWTVAADLRVGDEMQMMSDVLGGEEIQMAPWPADSRMTRGDRDWTAFASASDGPRVAITPRWGRFLGLFAGDGCATGTQVAISCDGQDQDLIEMICDDVKAMGLWPGTQDSATWGGEVLRRRAIYASSSHLIRFMRNLGIVRDDSVRRIITIPEVIWRSPVEVTGAYLAGLFEADGTIAGSGVSLSTKYHGFALQVQRLLAAFGIESTVRRRVNTAGGSSGTKRFESWLLTIRRAGADIFAEKIGFLSARKITKLAAVVAKPHSNAYRSQTWRDRIASIEPCEITPVDIQVDGEAFAAAGFFSHNSWLKPLEYMACGVPWVGSPRDEYRRLRDLTKCGALAKTPQDWYRATKELVGYPALRREASETGRAAIIEYGLTYESGGWARWAQAWEDALKIQRG